MRLSDPRARCNAAVLSLGRSRTQAPQRRQHHDGVDDAGKHDRRHSPADQGIERQLVAALCDVHDVAETGTDLISPCEYGLGSDGRTDGSIPGLRKHGCGPLAGGIVIDVYARGRPFRCT